MTDRGRHRWRTVGWTVVAVGGLVLYLRTVGVDAVAAALGRLTPTDAAVLVGLGWVPILLWGGSLHLVLRRLDAPTTLSASIGLFAASSFLNNVTPFGQAGGDPVSGALVARVEGVPFERGFAAIVSVGAANAVAVVALGVVGVGVLVGTAAVDDALLVAVGAGTVAAAVLGVVAVVAWWRRERVVDRIGGALGGVLYRVGRPIPGVESPAPDAVVARGRGFVAALERVGDSRRRLAIVLALGVAGHLAVATTLWLSLAVLNAPVSLARVLVVVPVARLAGASPTPGGTASAEALLTGLLVAVGGVETPVAAAAALLYRAAAFWIPTLGGGVVTALLVVTSGETYDSRR
ncbi:lysylphosphatidylglycerol synthase transmembrane domain-containing protein [Haloplanus aerogenes]|uniref:Uncharacterized protein n=1 Tax=Haloplanus aerogenes TaxID=660522 RepID=A0A3M0CV06_9EURY|nr:lysylphosphatidylglycerol synthase transmembrane domain-containing protein [Haloplanus aerogenes]RMB13211.1 hypothetical protein ATH50_2543 [Haloplanus aerogenes]